MLWHCVIGATARNEFLSFLDNRGVMRRYRPGVVLVKFRSRPASSRIVVKPGREQIALREISERADVEFAELDVVLTRQFVPNDPAGSRQWHHEIIHSSAAWSIGLGNQGVTLAILDTPFQMDHPDLAANTVPGWSMISKSAITLDAIGYYHSTIVAGMAAAVINNGLGGSGVVNCRIMPIDIGDQPTTSDMYDAIVWAADHGVRVVNLSWDGAFSSTINLAGEYLKQKTRGMLFMSGVNGRNFLGYPKHPHIYAVAMTDADDQPRSSYGQHIDFCAPGWDVYSTTTNATYEIDSGTSYSAPLLAGVAAWIMSINPDLGPAEIESVLISASVDLGSPGWDEEFGWGRIDFGRAALETFKTLPVSRIAPARNDGFQIEAAYVPSAIYRLFRTDNLQIPDWQQIMSPIVSTNERTLLFREQTPPPDRGFYKLQVELPR